MKHIFIVNNKVNNKETLEKLDLIKLDISVIASSRKLDYKIINVSDLLEIKKAVVDNAFQKDTIIYAVGGDGTVNGVIQNLPSTTPLVIIPVGKNNNIFKEVYNVDEYPLKMLINDNPLCKYNISQMDLGVCNNRLFASTVSIGLFNKLTKNNDYKIPRAISDYMTIQNYKAENLDLSFLKTEYQNRNYILEYMNNFTTLSINNGTYGEDNKTMTSSYSPAKDNKLEVLYTMDLTTQQMQVLAKSLREDKLISSSLVKYFKSESISITANKPIIYTIDGELASSEYMHLESKPKALTLKKPTL